MGTPWNAASVRALVRRGGGDGLLEVGVGLCPNRNNDRLITSYTTLTWLAYEAYLESQGSIFPGFASCST